VGPSLSPAVRRVPSYLRDSFAPHIAGQLLGGLLVGLVAAGLGELARTLLGSSRFLFILVVVGAYLVADLCGIALWRPSARRQVPRNFGRTIYHRMTAFLWGVDLGFGWSTKQPSTAFLTAFAGLLALSPYGAITGGIIFAMVRGLTVLIALGAPSRDEIERRYDAIRKREAVARAGSIASAAAVAAALLMMM
jgi:hypothetical protein